MSNENYLHNDLTEQIIKAYYIVYNELGYGFLENVYQNGLIFEMKNMNLDVKANYPISVHYKNQIVGNYKADILVNDLVILELKAVESLLKEHEYQLVNYLKATNIEIGLLMNFGNKPDIKRKFYTNDRKKLYQ